MPWSWRYIRKRKGKIMIWSSPHACPDGQGGASSVVRRSLTAHRNSVNDTACLGKWLIFSNKSKQSTLISIAVIKSLDEKQLRRQDFCLSSIPTPMHPAGRSQWLTSHPQLGAKRNQGLLSSLSPLLTAQDPSSGNSAALIHGRLPHFTYQDQGNPPQAWSAWFRQLRLSLG